MLKITLATTLIAGMLHLAIPAQAQEPFPARPVKLVSPYAPGALNDMLARTLAEGLAKRLGQQVLVDNKAGGSAQIGTDFVAKAAPDGYTLLMGSNEPLGVLPALKKTPYAIPKDFSFVARISTDIPWVIVVSTKLPVQTLAQFVAHARANPGSIRYGSNGVGSGGHLAFAMLEAQSRIRLTHVPYKGTAPLMTDLLGGHVDAGVAGVGTMLPHATSDKVRMIAVTAEQRHPFFPDVPTTTQGGVPNVNAEIWFGIVGPAGIPGPIVNRLWSEFDGLLKEPALRKSLTDKGIVPAALGPSEFERYAVGYFNNTRRFAEAHKIVMEE